MQGAGIYNIINPPIPCCPASEAHVTTKTFDVCILFASRLPWRWDLGTGPGAEDGVGARGENGMEILSTYASSVVKPKSGRKAERRKLLGVGCWVLGVFAVLIDHVLYGCIVPLATALITCARGS